MAEKKTAADEAAEKTAEATGAAEEGQAPAEPAAEVNLGPFTALANFLRNGAEVEVGKALSFAKGEEEHVKELLGMGVVHPGTGADARKAVQNAEAARDVARHTPPV